MKAKERMSLRYGDKVIVTKNMTSFGRNGEQLYGKIGTVVEDKRINFPMPPTHAHTSFMVDFGNGIYTYCCGYNCNKLTQDTNGFISVER